MAVILAKRVRALAHHTHTHARTHAHTHTHTHTLIYIFIYVYVYIYIERENIFWLVLGRVTTIEDHPCPRISFHTTWHVRCVTYLNP